VDPELLMTILIAIPGFLLAIVCHEAAHAWVADLRGDPTARMLGRITLNPVKHIDPWGTILMPALMLVLSQGSMVFGYARPTPVSPRNFRSPKWDSVLVSLAGPVANVLLAATLIGVAWLGHAVGLAYNPGFLAVLRAGLNINLILAAFNLLPIPPLDGSELVSALLPPKWAARYEGLAPYGFWILMGLYALGLLRLLMGPIYLLLQALLVPLGNPF
jgi:Zn-dependent protease